MIVDTDWESCVWHSSDEARMRKVFFAYARKYLDEPRARAWAEDLRAIAARGEYFFGLNRYLFSARAGYGCS